MEFIPLWAVWLSLAVAFLIGEIFTAGVFLVCFGVGALCASATAWLGLGEGIQWGLFAAVSAAGVFCSRIFADRYAKEPPRRAGVDRFIGEEAIVIEPVDGNKEMGRVRVLHEDWRAVSDAGQVFQKDAKTLVVGVHGVHLVVTDIGGEKE